MNQTANLDLSRQSFEEFLKFFFAHPENEQFWYADQKYALSEAVISGPALVDHLTMLFSGFGVSTSGYSAAQISHGLWAMLSPTFSLQDALWDTAVPLEKRQECIRGMGTLFRDFVSANDAEPLQKCFYMWWHIVVTGFWAQAGQFEVQDVAALDPESSTLLNTMFDVLKQVLRVPDPRTQGYALHGLGHLQHPGVRELVQRYLDENKNRFTEEHVQWIEQCRDGVVS
jgi:hypothetical protein